MMNLAYRMLQKIYRGNIKHMIRFSIVGVSNTLIDFAAFTVFYSVFRLNYIPSQVLGYSVGILNSFIFNRRWTFGDGKSSKIKGKKTVNEFIQFVAINLVSLTTSVIAMDLLVKYVSMNVYLSKIAVIMIAQLINFLSYKLWIFAPEKSVAPALYKTPSTMAQR
jgi:putative flippase GtrA